MAPLRANVVPTHEGLPAGVPASWGCECARQLVRALAAGTVANLRQRTRRACPWNQAKPSSFTASLIQGALMEGCAFILLTFELTT